jgi:CheY-like chemotaxis protein
VSESHAVLVVEDDPPTRELIVDLLREEGYTVEAAETGAEALALLDRDRAIRRFCLILLDVNLPQVDGLAVLHYLADHGLPVPVIAMSASATQLTNAVAAGAREVLPKPFGLEQLLTLVAQNCRHRARLLS